MTGRRQNGILFPLVLTLALGLSPLRSDCAPDVLLIAVDDLRPMLGCYGDRKVQTPNIDRLASRGVIFERAYCQSAKCGPSRLSLMTGLRPETIGVFGNSLREVSAWRKKNPEIPSVARWFKDQGYETRAFGKIDHDTWEQAEDWSVKPFSGRPKEMLEIVPEAGGASVIADRWQCPVFQSPAVEDEALFAGRMAREVVRLIETRSRKAEDAKPLFLAVGFRRPHLPFVAPKKYFDLYEPDESWLARNQTPPSESPVMAWFNSDGYIGGARKLGLKMPNPPGRAEAVEWNGYEMRSYEGVPNYGAIEPPLQLKLKHAYAACVSYVDSQIGKILTALEKSDSGSDTIIVLFSDHGWHLGEQSAWGKMTNFEIATRVPLVIAGPGINPSRTDTITELVDLYPTLCDLSGIAQPSHLQGKSLGPLLRSGTEDPSACALSVYPRYSNQYLGWALRTDRYRLVVWEEGKTGQIVARELYDHQSDPAESSNLATDAGRQNAVSELELILRKKAPGLSEPGRFP